MLSGVPLRWWFAAVPVLSVLVLVAAVSALQELVPAPLHARALLALAGTGALVLGLLGVWGARRLAQSALRPYERDAAQLKRVIDGLPIALAVLDCDFRIEYLNDAHRRLLGWTNERARGKRSSELLLDPPVAAEMARAQQRLRETLSEVAGRFDVRSADGRRVPVQAHVAPLADAQGRFDGALLTLQDQSAEAMARQRSDELANRLRLFADAALDYALVMLDGDGCVLSWSRGARAITGLERADAVGRHFEFLFNADDRQRNVPRTLIDRALADGQADVEGWLQRTQGERFWCRGSLYSLPVGGDAARLALIARDITQYHEAAQREAENQAKLMALTQRLLAQEKDTQRRLAHALHDGLGQTLAAMRLVYDGGSANVDANGLAPELARWLDRLIAESNRQVRQVLTELRPPLLDERGLVAALEDELRQRQVLHPDLALQLEAPQAWLDPRWPADVEYAVYMIAREALNNAMRHARAHTIVVAIEGDEARLRVSVRDDGRGLPEGGAAERPGHLGLVGMRERALAIGAALRVDSTPGEGTAVSVEWGEENDESPVLGG